MKNKPPLSVVFHYPDGTTSTELKEEYKTILAKKIGEVASEVLSDESYIALATGISKRSEDTA